MAQTYTHTKHSTSNMNTLNINIKNKTEIAFY